MSSREQANGSEVEFGGKGPPSGSPKIGRTDRGLDSAEVRRQAQETRVASAVKAGKGEREATEGRSVGVDTLYCNGEELETGDWRLESGMEAIRAILVHLGYQAQARRDLVL